MLTGYLWTIGMTSAVIFENKVIYVFNNKRYMKQSNREEIGQNIKEPTTNKREKLKSLREHLKLCFIKSMNCREKVNVDQTDSLSFKTFTYNLDTNKLFKTISRNMQNRIVNFDLLTLFIYL
jgi:hypothetical protein